MATTPQKKTPALAPAKKVGAKAAASRAAAKAQAAAPVAKAGAPAPAPAPRPAKAAKAAKPEKVKKPKLVRDSFTIPKTEYEAIDTLKQRAAKAGAPAKKSELLRAGIKALSAMGDAAFLAALQAVPAIKTGRPSAKA